MCKKQLDFSEKTKDTSDFFESLKDDTTSENLSACCMRVKFNDDELDEMIEELEDDIKESEVEDSLNDEPEDFFKLLGSSDDEDEMVEEIIDMSDDTFLKLAKMAHSKDITINQMIQEILEKYINITE